VKVLRVGRRGVSARASFVRELRAVAALDHPNVVTLLDHGQVLLTYLFVYPIARSLIEVFRGDGERGALFHWGSEAVNRALGLPSGSWVLLSTSQFISLLVAGTAVGLLVWLRRRREAVASGT
jgi:prolipoprotein diacylglyceryltransferase